MSKFYYDKKVYLMMVKGIECLMSNFLKKQFIINHCERYRTNDFAKKLNRSIFIDFSFTSIYDN